MALEMDGEWGLCLLVREIEMQSYWTNSCRDNIKAECPSRSSGNAKRMPCIMQDQDSMPIGKIPAE